MDEQGQLMSLSTVAASNVAKALELPDEHIPKIEQALKDEIDALSAHFTMAFADIQEQYARGLTEIESEFSFVKKYPGRVFAWAFVAFALGAIVGSVL